MTESEIKALIVGILTILLSMVIFVTGLALPRFSIASRIEQSKI